MALDPSPSDWSDSSLDTLILRIQEHAGSQGYAVVKGITKRFKDGPFRKIWLRCDRGGKPEKNSKSTGKRVTSSRLIDCPFQVIAQRTRINGVSTDWALTVDNPEHNHGFIPRGAHPSLRKIALTQEVQDTIVNDTRTGSRPSQILSSLRLDTDEEDPIYKPSDIYNVKSQTRIKTLGSMTPTQALMRQLHDREDWFVRFANNPITHQLEFLFFCQKSSQQILKINYEVLILDATYKTNKYKLPLLVITGVTALNTSFYVAFAFMKSEHTPDYVWVIEQLKELYNELDIPYPSVLLTDTQGALINACVTIFPTSAHMLCIWHIENNITKNCSKYFAKQEDFDTFREEFRRIMYATTEEAFDREWDSLQEKYTSSYPSAISYIADKLIIRKQKFVAFWINQNLHFNNRATSRGECNNGKLKQQLGGLSIGDLENVVQAIDTMLINERHTYNIKHGEAKMRLPQHLKKPIFRDLYTKVSPFALKEMLPQYLKVINHHMKPCTRYFTTTMGLPCAHVMEQRMLEAAGVLKLEDIHSHWRLDKENDDTRSNTINENANVSDEDGANTELLLINEPAIAKPLGRPPGAKNKKRTRYEAFEDSTQREPSGFERTQASGRKRAQGASQGGARGGEARGGARGGASGRGARGRGARGGASGRGARGGGARGGGARGGEARGGEARGEEALGRETRGRGSQGGGSRGRGSRGGGAREGASGRAQQSMPVSRQRRGGTAIIESSEAEEADRGLEANSSEANSTPEVDRASESKSHRYTLRSTKSALALEDSGTEAAALEDSGTEAAALEDSGTEAAALEDSGTEAAALEDSDDSDNDSITGSVMMGRRAGGPFLASLDKGAEKDLHNRHSGTVG